MAKKQQKAVRKLKMAGYFPNRCGLSSVSDLHSHLG
jgi:hypothetical protein